MNSSLIAAGPPPLTLEAADCSIDVIDFMAAAVRGVDLIDVTEAVREAWRSYLAANYPMLNPADRYWFATAPSTLAAIRTNWPQMPEMQRDMYRQAWAASLPAMLQFIDPVMQAAAPLQRSPSYYPNPGGESMPGGPNAQQAYPGNSGNDSVSNLISQIHSKQRKQEQDALQEGGLEYQQQVAMQNQALNMQTLTNMSKMSFDSMMSVAKNMKY